MEFPFSPLYQYCSNFWPSKMLSLDSRAMLIAIGLQESRFKYRCQIGGPARGFWQFEEMGGVRGVLTHPSTRSIIRDLLKAWQYDDSTRTSYIAIEHNDVLAATYARLLLWTIAGTMPTRGEHDYAWRYYIAGWRPGKPHRETWDKFYDQAWEMVLT